MKKTVAAAWAAIAFVLPLAAADISGSWTFAGEVVGNPVSLKCVFKQEAAKLTGTCTHEGMSASPTTGDVTGDKVTFQHQLNVGQVYDLTFTGTLDVAGTAIKGDIAVAGVSGTFSGTKDKGTDAPK